MVICYVTIRAQLYSPSMKPIVNSAETKKIGGSSVQGNRNYILMSQEKWDHLNHPGCQWKRKRQKRKPNKCYDKLSILFIPQEN